MNKLVFIGQEETGLRCLEALVRQGAPLVATYVRAAGGVGIAAFEELAGSDLPVYAVEDINAATHVESIGRLQPDMIYQISWSQLLREELLAIPRHGVVGMHCSLLPRHRGRAPIPWSIILGLRRSGMSMFYLDTRADRGDLIGQEEFAIGPHDYAAEVYDKACAAAVRLVDVYHPQLLAGTAPRISQCGLLSDYWPKRTPCDGLIDWNMAAPRLYDWVRALSHPFPGAFAAWRGERLRVWRASVTVAAVAAAGTVVGIDEAGIAVATGEGVLRLETVQGEGEEEEPATAYADRRGLAVGDRIE